MELLSNLSITKEKREEYSSLLLLDRMINGRLYLPIGEYDDSIDPILIKMDAGGYIRLDDTTYVPTEKGRDALQKFKNRYHEFLKVFDIYCAVDLVEGEFAFGDDMFEMNDLEWEQHLGDDRFEDLRMAVCSIKNYDPLEAAFMIFVDQNRFDLESDNWEFQLISTLIWDEMELIVKESKSIEHLSYVNEDGDEISGDSVLKDVMEQGTELMFSILEKEKEVDQKIADEEAAEEEEEEEEEYEGEVVYVETVVEEYHDMDYYDPYWDPYYTSPLFYDPMIMW